MYHTKCATGYLPIYLVWRPTIKYGLPIKIILLLRLILLTHYRVQVLEGGQQKNLCHSRRCQEKAILQTCQHFRFWYGWRLPATSEEAALQCPHCTGLIPGQGDTTGAKHPFPPVQTNQIAPRSFSPSHWNIQVPYLSGCSNEATYNIH